MQRTRGKALGWWVVCDAPGRGKPTRVSAHLEEEAARREARRLNAVAEAPGRPLYFVEFFETSSVLDCCAATR